MPRYRVNFYPLRSIENMFDEQAKYSDLPETTKSRIATMQNLGYRPFIRNRQTLGVETSFRDALEGIKEDIGFSNVLKDRNVSVGIPGQVVPEFVQFREISFWAQKMVLELDALDLIKSQSYLSPYSFQTLEPLNDTPIVVKEASTSFKENTDEEVKYFRNRVRFPYVANSTRIFIFSLHYKTGVNELTAKNDSVWLSITDDGFGGSAYVQKGWSEETRQDFELFSGQGKLDTIIYRAIDYLNENYIKVDNKPQSYEPKLNRVTDSENYTFLTEYDDGIIEELQRRNAKESIGFVIYDAELTTPNGLISTIIDKDSETASFLNTSKAYKWGIYKTHDYSTSRGLMRWSGSRLKFPFEFSELADGFMNLPMKTA